MRNIFKWYRSRNKFNKNPSSGSKVVSKNIHKTNIIQTNKQASKTYAYLSLQNKDSETWLSSEVMKLISRHRNSFRFQNKSKMNSVLKNSSVYV
jgi:hypothetical protein